MRDQRNDIEVQYKRLKEINKLENKIKKRAHNIRREDVNWIHVTLERSVMRSC